jgi:cytochrome b561
MSMTSPKPMPPSEARRRYGGIAQSLHWATAVLVLVAFMYGPGGSEARVYLPSRDAGRQLHETLGSAVFALTIVRLVWRMVATRPDPAPVNRWLGLAARLVQALLYLLLLAVPLTAILGAWLEGHPLAYLGGIDIAAPIPPSRDLGVTVATIHSWLGDVILWVTGLHALAALHHHFVLKDGVLESMLPGWLHRRSGRRVEPPVRPPR